MEIGDIFTEYVIPFILLVLTGAFAITSGYMASNHRERRKNMPYHAGKPKKKKPKNKKGGNKRPKSSYRRMK
tara:strand:+ start:1003 stop:1218 length:216 start_codon:yes stop_codon:yes gene_type:complete